MNTPNKLTLLRMILVIPFIALMSAVVGLKDLNGQTISFTNINPATICFIVAGVIFVLAMITDFIDGKLARKNNQITMFGKLFDPLADKFMTTSAMIFLSVLGIVPIWMTVVFVLRDILVDGSRNVAAKNNLNVAASIWGKAKTMLQSVGLTIIFFVFPSTSRFELDFLGNPVNWELFLLNLPILFATLLSVVSGWQYFKQIIPYINAK